MSAEVRGSGMRMITALYFFGLYSAFRARSGDWLSTHHHGQMKWPT
jgi:hypothetical protein